MSEHASEIILIGGSAGSYNLINEILEILPSNLEYAICIALHRNPSFPTKIETSLSKKLKRPILSVVDKMQIRKNHVYFAPPAYHLLVEPNFTFSLDSSEPINFSRPSIDVLFQTCAQVYGEKCIAFLLSGANSDGAVGLKTIEDFGGKTFIQDPKEAIIDTMPLAGITLSSKANIVRNQEIINYFYALS